MKKLLSAVLLLSACHCAHAPTLNFMDAEGFEKPNGLKEDGPLFVCLHQPDKDRLLCMSYEEFLSIAKQQHSRLPADL